ncbi:BrnT family toxin [Methylobacterium sp. NEAU 140]|uniref:BrnT family toxin n=1 Tax=Methylobacterium sp. NEAU 140 TaxID=3064945 RepID=UPI0027363FD6|nr:BrnT family toxin [Methylobacterium sp. NEAU 140]MDP4023414.1 BrnT family toxin [Methylobacterium sp. NEAU 140]
MAIGGFDWDDGNWPKCGKHGVSRHEIEYILRNSPRVRPDRQGGAEVRFDAVGVTADNRHVFVVFTLREQGGTTLIRPISARYMHRREIDTYDRTREA